MRALTDLYGRIVAVLAIAAMAAAKPPGRPQPPPSPEPFCKAHEESSASDVARRAVLARAPRPLSDARAIMSAAGQRRVVVA
jgi:hypothetical protein